jgi:peptide/nickel transport system substrate-binding protein
MGRHWQAPIHWGTRARYLVLGFAVIGIVLGLAACGSSGSSSGSSSPGGAAPTANVLKVADTGAITTWDPRASSSSESRILANFYEPLIWANPPGSAEPYSPALATSWETSQGGKVWTFHLRHGVTFHDGTAFNAQAVKYSYDATKKLGLGLAYIWSDLKEVKVVDPYTVQLVLDQPIPLEPLVSSEYAAWIFSPKTAGKTQAWWDKGREDGTGPYMLQSYSPNQETVLTRYPAYWGGFKNNQFRKVVFEVAQDASTQRQMLESGAVDLQESVGRDAVQAMQAESGIHVYIVPSLVSQILYLNTQHKPLNNPLVRQALAYATPYSDIIAAAINNLGTQSNGPMPAGLWPRDDSVQPYTYDMTKAKQLMAQAGYPNGGFKMLMTYPTEENPADTTMATLLKESWAKLGVTLNLQPMLWAQAWQKAKGPNAARQDALSITWWPAYSHGKDSLTEELHSESTPIFNLAYWYNKGYDNLIDTAWTTEATDRTKAKQLYDQAQVMIHDQAPIIYLWDLKAVYAANSKLKIGPDAISQPYPNVIRVYYITL